MPKPRSRTPDMDRPDWQDRRSSPRLPISAIRALKGVKLVPGAGVNLINISRGGALLEANICMKPNAHICIRLETAEAVYTLRGRVLRSRAARLSGPSLIFECAVTFDEQLVSLLPKAPPKETAVQNAESSIEEACAAGEVSDQTLAVTDDGIEESYTITANVPDGKFTLSEVLGVGP